MMMMMMIIIIIIINTLRYVVGTNVPQHWPRRILVFLNSKLITTFLKW